MSSRITEEHIQAYQAILEQNNITNKQLKDRLGIGKTSLNTILKDIGNCYPVEKRELLNNGKINFKATIIMNHQAGYIPHPISSLMTQMLQEQQSEFIIEDL